MFLPYRCYLWIFALTVGGVLAIVGTFNLIVDPYGYFHIFEIAGLNAVKPRPDHDLADVKRAAWLARPHNALILGNSRAEVGFDPDHPGFAARGLSAFNFALPGTGLRAAWKIHDDLSREHPQTLLIVGLEFLDFLVLPDAPASEELVARRETKAASASRHLKALFTSQALLDSVRTVANQKNKNAAVLTARGFNPLREYQLTARNDGYWALFRQRAAENARSYVREPKSVLLGNGEPGPTFATLRAILRAAPAETHLVIYPYHVQLLLLFEEAGLWSAFEDWKRSLVMTIDEERAAGRLRAKVTLWDFSGVSEPASEAIPPPKDRKTELHWYWEGGHFKSALGDRMLSQILGEPEFGVSLSAEMLDAHLARLRAGMADYRGTKPQLASEAAELIDAAKGN